MGLELMTFILRPELRLRVRCPNSWATQVPGTFSLTKCLGVILCLELWAALPSEFPKDPTYHSSGLTPGEQVCGRRRGGRGKFGSFFENYLSPKPSVSCLVSARRWGQIGLRPNLSFLKKLWHSYMCLTLNDHSDPSPFLFWAYVGSWPSIVYLERYYFFILLSICWSPADRF